MKVSNQSQPQSQPQSQSQPQTQLQSQSQPQSQQSSSRILVSMSGFVHDPKLDTYKQMLQALSCKYADQLSHDVNYLIVNHTCTEKYKIAELRKSITECIGIKWLEDSNQKGKLLPIEKYRIVGKIFHGVHVVMEGFEAKGLQQKLASLLQENGATQVRNGVTGLLTLELNEKYQVILVPNSKFYRKLQLSITQFLNIPVVTPQWLEQSLLAKQCKYPYDYALNYQYIYSREFNDNANTQRLNRKLNSFMGLDLLNNQDVGLFSQQSRRGEQVIIYIDCNTIEEEFASLLRRIICVNEGLWVSCYGPYVTHVLVGSIEEGEMHKMMAYGDHTSILRVEWLIDSVLFAQKLPEIDYKVRSFKQPLIKSMNMLEIKDVTYDRQQRSHTFIHSSTNLLTSNPACSLPLAAPALKRKSTNSISMPKQPVTVTKLIPVSKLKATKTDIFKGRYFYIQKMMRKQTSIMAICNKIKQNGGSPISQVSLSQLKNKKIFMVLKDSDKNQQYLKQFHDKTQANGITPIAVSPRWIEQCIKKSNYIDYNQSNYLTFKPFLFETPVRELMSMKIQLVGIEQILKRRYKELLVALGINKISPNLCQITHCLCGKDYKTDGRYKQIMAMVESNSITASNQKQKQQRQKETVTKQSSAMKSSTNLGQSIKFIQVKWLIDLLNEKGKVNIDAYAIVDQ